MGAGAARPLVPPAKEPPRAADELSGAGPWKANDEAHALELPSEVLMLESEPGKNAAAAAPAGSESKPEAPPSPTNPPAVTPRPAEAHSPLQKDLMEARREAAIEKAVADFVLEYVTDRAATLPISDVLEAACKQCCAALGADFVFLAADQAILETDRDNRNLPVGPEMKVLGSHRRRAEGAPSPEKQAPVSPHTFNASREGDLAHAVVSARPGPLALPDPAALRLEWPPFLGSQASAAGAALVPTSAAGGSAWGVLVACWRAAPQPEELSFAAGAAARFAGAVQSAVEHIRSVQSLKEGESLLRFEKAIADRIVNSVLPRHVVTEMLCNHRPVARVYSGVSILFADICGFTAMAGQMGAPELVQFLNDIFSAFDAIARSIGVEKIKTIGDCYMCAAGMEEGEGSAAANANHAANAIEMGLGMLHAVELFNAHFGTTLQMRIGIHSGSVVAGVIGQTKLAYDLWGDTVNLASRMESTGEPGRVHVSDATYRLAEGKYRWDAPRETLVKGKEGPLQTRTFQVKPPSQPSGFESSKSMPATRDASPAGSPERGPSPVSPSSGFFPRAGSAPALADVAEEEVRGAGAGAAGVAGA
eukprot:tig00000042_g15648.t1